MPSFPRCKVQWCLAMREDDCDYCATHCGELHEHLREERTPVPVQPNAVTRASAPLPPYERTRWSDLHRAHKMADLCLEVNEPGHRGRWKTQPAREHLDHALVHLKAAMGLGPVMNPVDDLVSAYVRLGMALEIAMQASEKGH